MKAHGLRPVGRKPEPRDAARGLERGEPMLFLENLLTAIEQVWANKLRSVLTVLGIVIAVTSTLIVVAVVQGFAGYVTTFLVGLGTNAIWVFPERPQRYETTPVLAEMVRGDVEEVENACPAIEYL